jgi:DNA-binding NtrC family response regulator
MDSYDQPVKILCVDDEINILNAMKRSFLDEEYEIVVSDSTEEGLRLLESAGPFQIVISDYRMPTMNGVEFLRTVGKRCPDTILIVLSGYGDAGTIEAAINEGHIYKFIPKPWNTDELLGTIQKCFDHYFLEQKKREQRQPEEIRKELRC